FETSFNVPMPVWVSKRPPLPVVKKIRPSGSHAPPPVTDMLCGIPQIFSVCPPPTGALMSDCPCANPTHKLSGDQNGGMELASSAILRASMASIGRTQRAPSITYATAAPSGEIEPVLPKSTWEPFNGISNRRTGCLMDGRGQRRIATLAKIDTTAIAVNT